MTSHTWADPGSRRGGRRRAHAGLAGLAASLCVAATVATAAPAAGATGGGEVLEAPAEAGRPTVDAAGVALWDPADGRLLYGRDAHRARPMASLTKMLTSLLLVEHADSPNETITASANAASVGGATVDLQAGQQVPLPSLVAGLMVESGNDAALAAAEHVAGTQAAFVELMTRRARELGAEAASFVNASGLTNDPAHHATPLGLARIAEAAMREALIARFAATRAVTPEGLPPLVNRNELLASYPGADGIKTGYTSAAGFCVAASATREDWRLIAVVLDSPERFGDAAELLDWGYATFDRARAAGAGEAVATWRRGGSATALVTAGEAGVTVPAGSPAWLRLRVAPHVAAPVPRGAALGQAQLRVGGEAVAAVPLTAASRVNAPGGATSASSPASHLGQGLAEALRGLARAAPVQARVARQDGRDGNPD